MNLKKEQMIEKYWSKRRDSEPLYLSLSVQNVCKFDPLFKKKSLGSEIEIKDISVVLSERLSRSEHRKFQVSVNKMSTRWQTSNIPHTCASRQKSLRSGGVCVNSMEKKDLKFAWVNENGTKRTILQDIVSMINIWHGD